jgi:acetyl esterase/lipase
VVVGKLTGPNFDTPGAIGGNTLIVSFEKGSTADVMQAVVRRIAFSAVNASPSTQTRTIVFSFVESRPSEDVVFKEIEGTSLRMRVYQPDRVAGAEPRPAALFFHGGGWTTGVLGQFRQQLSYLASRGLVAIDVEYRLLPQNVLAPPVSAIRDAKSAVRWVRQHATELGVDPNRIAATGASAGGHLAASAGMIDGVEEAGEDQSISSRPNLLILWNAVVDNGPDGYAPELFGAAYPQYSPAYNASADDPPVLAFYAGNDSANPLPIRQRFQNTLQTAGIENTFYTFPGGSHTAFNVGFFNDRYAYDSMRIVDQYLSQRNWLTGAPALALPDAYALELGVIPGTVSAVQVDVKLAGNAAPTLTNLLASQQWVENGVPLFVAKTARVWEDSADFNGGTLTIANVNGDSRDRLQLWNVGDGAGQIGISGNTIRYGGATIGTYTGGVGSMPLVVTFNSAAATPMAVQNLLYRVGFQALGDNPLAGVRQITFKLVDRDGLASAIATTSVEVVAVNDPPALAGIVSSDYPASGGPYPFLPGATVTDPDSPNFDTGGLTVHFQQGVSSQNRIALSGVASVDSSTGKVSLNGVVIGTRTSDGVGLNDWSVAFNANATPGRVQQLVRLLTFSTTGGAVHPQLQLTLNDGDGGSSSATLSLYLPTALTGILPDRGRSANDRVTNTGVVTFSGIGYPGDNITLTGPGGAVLFRSTVNSVGAWQMDSRTKPFADGTYALTLQSSNGAGSTAPAVNFSITIDTTNPSFSLPSTSITYLEDAGPRTVSGFATNLSAGPAEAGPIFFGVLSYSNPSLFVVQPTIDSNGTLTYQSRPNANGSATLSIKAVDLAGNASPPQSFTIQVTPVNDAPVLNGRATPSLGTMLEDTPNPVEATVSSLLVGNVVEVDGDPVGIAVVAIGNPGKGTYQYQLAGGTWTDMGPVSETSALLLPGDAKVRIVPKADANGIVNFLFRAWDGTSGTPGNKMSLSGSYGGTGSVSSAFAKAVCTITAVNDAPVLTASSSATLGYTRGTSGVLLLGGLATVQDVDSPRLTGGQLKIAGLTGNDVISVTGRYSISDNSLFFTADSQPSVSLGSVDTAADGGSSFTITFNANATLDLIQRLVRTLKFSTTGTSGPRTLQITLSDDQQAVSNMVTRMVNVS